MMPWGHLAVGYLLYTLGTRLWHGRPPASLPTLGLVVGTQFPDLIDKPLAYWIGVLEGRAVGHSLLFVVPLCLIVLYLANRYDRRQLGAAFGVGALSHLLADSVLTLVFRDYGISYLLWPILPAPAYGVESFYHHVHQLLATLHGFRGSSLAEILASAFAVQLFLSGLVVVLWMIDGYPVVRPLVRAIRSR